jgi:8-oxo-dGTP pyrophosphatase MutT (NUDIX family)
MVRTWPRLSRRTLHEARVFTLVAEEHVSPRTRETLEAVVLESSDWCNVIAVTEADELVMVRQFRFGTQQVELEIPGGIVDPGEDPLLSAQRELLEETGYRAARWSSLGSVAPNPAIHRNRLHSFLAEGCVHVAEQEFDAFEDISVDVLPRARVDALIADGTICHALVVVAFQKWALLRAGHVLK